MTKVSWIALAEWEKDNLAICLDTVTTEEIKDELERDGDKNKFSDEAIYEALCSNSKHFTNQFGHDLIHEVIDSLRGESIRDKLMEGDRQ
jgi:hypothetical protein